MRDVWQRRKTVVVADHVPIGDRMNAVNEVFNGSSLRSTSDLG